MGEQHVLFDPTGENPIFNPGQTVENSSITVAGSDLQSTPYEIFNKVNFPPRSINNLNSKNIVNNDDMNSSEEAMRHYGSNSLPLGTNELLNSSIYIINESIDSQTNIAKNKFSWEDDNSLTQDQKDEINSIFTSRKQSITSFTYFVDIAINIAKVIYSSKSDGFNQRRQTIFSAFGGWDHHTSLRSNLDPRLLAMNAAIEALVTFLKHPLVDLYDSVVICHGGRF